MLAAALPVTSLVNAELSGSQARSLRFAGARILAIGAEPQRGDRVLDLHGDRVLPGLINAHDHLQLNGLPQLIYRPRYANAARWIRDVECRLHTDRRLLAHRAIAREQRLFLGGIKNILSGVTTVAHHDPLHPSLHEAQFPTQVLERFGWSHSLFLDGAAAVRRAHHTTPPDRPWIIHAAEGRDADARGEFERLLDLDCITANTVLVHGLALSAGQRRALVRAGAGLIWCPSSNLNLYGASAPVQQLVLHGRVALGSDSRISAGRDLLAELRTARELSGFDEPLLLSLVTDRAAALLRLPDRGALRVGAQADLLVLPAGRALADCARADVRLVIMRGRARYGDAAYAAALGDPAQFAPVQVDGCAKLLERAWVERLVHSQVHEPGLAAGGLS